MKQLLLFEKGEVDANHQKCCTSIEQLTILDVGLDLLKGRVQKQTTGPNYKGLCIYHNEKTPSFYLKPKYNKFICYGCHAEGGPMILLFNSPKCPTSPYDYLTEKVRFNISNLVHLEQLEATLKKEIDRFQCSESYLEREQRAISDLIQHHKI